MEKQISITGVVQGVGFRPFVYGLANRFHLRGWVCNTSEGVEIVVQGQKSKVESFICCIEIEAPPLAKIDSICVRDEPSHVRFSTFDIRPSTTDSNAYQPISPDVAICPDCERELFDPKDRRYLYPFINCTNCGPRFTIIKDIPYDRPNTTMANFQMCDACRAEYEDPNNRRFHAQPIACPHCGPFVELRKERACFPHTGSLISSIECRLTAILETRRLLHAGYIVAIKGLGGFHLACDATNPYAVGELRRRKGRAGKPFAIMVPDLGTAQSICHINDEERALLTSHEKPVVLLAKKTLRASKTLRISNDVAPNLDTLGVMLPYTPIHLLLLNQTDPILMREPAPPILVMTSGNFSEEPIATDNLDALQKLHPLADAFLLHDRDIHVRCDDSVVRLDDGRQTIDPGNRMIHRPSSIVYLRRSRGYAPYPIHLSFTTKPTLAVGGELKNTFCLTRDRYAFISQHIGDMENVETYESFERGVESLSHIFRIQPEIIAYDLHPNYFTTQYAKRSNIKLIGVQHHHAHIAACMADNGLDERRLIGLAFDGTGYGTDGTIWGGEVLLASYLNFERIAHLQPLPLPGSDSAIHHPWKIAVGYCHALGIEIDDLPFLKNIDQQFVEIIRQQTDKKLNAPLTSSMGRLFDAVASLIGIRNDVTYEAQAAIEMEVLSKPFVAMVKPYPYSIKVCHPEPRSGEGSLPRNSETLQSQQTLPQSDMCEEISLKELFAAIVKSIRSNESTEMISARFHKTIAAISLDICKRARIQTDINEIALSGGVWQNQILLNLVRDGLEDEGFVVYFHKQVPANDGGLSLGQVVIANTVIASE